VATSTGSTILAERYARACLSVAIDKNADAAALGAEIDGVAQLLADHPALAEVLASPTIPADKRSAVLDDVVSGQNLSAAAVNLLKLLVTRERMGILGQVGQQYQRLLLEHQKVQHGDVTSARALSEAQKAKLSESLGGALGKTMVLNYQTDASLVGGIVVRIDNRVFDASVVMQLQRLREKTLSSL